MRRRTTTRAGALLALLLAGTAGVAGCTGDDAAPEDVSATTVRVLVRDINLRPVGADCAGTGGYQYFHHKAPFRVLDGEDRALVTGTLPAGTAVAVFDEDLGVERVPTYCEFAVPVSVPQRAAYRLEVAGKPAHDLTSDSSEGPALVAVVP
ncbi:hypothetical protein E1091_13300 [Micromonospora fluostatini]|uniref:Lipoprotein n=2 Tax=Micromonospora TaxID=1873 RepID=A0A136PP08_9ACTN|nr:hypothetical protein [Micromonospora rosaria]KXK60084.1 hypothetical protein AWW66_20735 [Micromonospora rosaria]TDB92124.1 hypothetical protein E1091_13300 [Micromonospora fluostatini]